MSDAPGAPGRGLLEALERRALLFEMRKVAMAASELVELVELKRRTRAAWAAGDYHSIARSFWDVGARIVRRVGVAPGEDVIDVACGTGNAAIRAAEAGARVVGLDLASELFDVGRGLAADAGVTVDWREGDAESLPFDDESFDVALSTFGAMFAPRHEVAAGELVRVLRPGGRIGLCSWTPGGALGDFLRMLASHLPPPPPPSAAPPLLWGSEDHVRELFDGTGIGLEFDRESVDFRYDSVEAAVETTAADFGPLVKARELLEPQGRWEPLQSDLTAFFRDHDVAAGPEVAFSGEYLVVLGRKHA
jgi:SAM-dependent methyltransferase